jgi:hypothetical protein
MLSAVNFPKPQAPPVGAGAADGPAKKKWTIMYYFDGKNNLAPMAEHSFSAVDQVGSDENVNLVAQIGLPKKDVLEGLITKGDGTKNFVDIGDANMGSGDNIQSFVERTMKQYPAEHYALVVWDHGAGFMGSCVDEEKNHMITNADMAAALENAAKTTGQKIDVLSWNACLMNQAETAYELRNAASYMTGSEEVEAGFRIPIPGLFGTAPQHTIAEDVKTAVKQNGDLAPQDFAKLAVYESKHQFGASMFTPTQSAIDLSRAQNLTEKCNNLAALILETVQKDPKMIEVVRQDIGKSQHFIAADMYIQPYNDYHDVGDFARVIEKDKRFTDPRIANAARDLQGAVKDAVIAQWHAPVSSMGGRSLEGSTGVSVYLTPHYGFDKAGKSSIDNIPQGGTHGHEKTAFAKDTCWDQMLAAVATPKNFKGNFPKLQRTLESFGQVSAYYGYSYAYEAAMHGMANAGGLFSFTLWPIMNFPFFIPIPQTVGLAAAAVGGALKLQKGASKLAEGIRRTESTAGARGKLIGDGLIDLGIGGGVIATCGAILAGHGQVMAPVAAGVLALGVGRLAYGLGKQAYQHFRNRNVTIDDKIKAMDNSRPNFPNALPQQPPAPAPAPPQQVGGVKVIGAAPGSALAEQPPVAEEHQPAPAVGH